MCCVMIECICFFFNDTATTEIYTYLHTLSLHDALPISAVVLARDLHHPEAAEVRRGELGIEELEAAPAQAQHELGEGDLAGIGAARSEEHTSELQSLMRISYAVFCLKKKNTRTRLHKHTNIH